MQDFNGMLVSYSTLQLTWEVPLRGAFTHMLLQRPPVLSLIGNHGHTIHVG